MDISEDISEEILGHLSSDFPSLKACSLSNSSFLPPTRRLLLSNVKLRHCRQNSHTDICLNFRETLLASKYMQSSIRTLILHHWYLIEDINYQCIFPSLLELIPDLRRVHIYLGTNKATIFGASFFPPPHSISSVRHLILHEIVFETFAQMLSVFASFSNLEVISASRISFDDPGTTDHIPVPSHHCTPSTLELNMGGAALECLFNSPQSTISIANLRVLSVLVFERNIFAIASLLFLSSSSLEHLTFIPAEIGTYSRNHVDLRQQSRLRRISTSLGFGSQAWAPKDLPEPFPWAHRFFRTLPTSVEDIFIQVGFSPYDAILLPQKQKEWQELDHILASHPGNFTVRLGICLDYHFCDPDDDDPCYSEWPTCGDMEEYFRNFLLVDGMPEMNKLGCLNCEITRSGLNFSTYINERW
ncbi:uncharacterized protein ARMOST_19681 [Armillaria ostoyae]|uniref:F-box domain-containing protein n=1 Tax=Armillaria ostoyae TaxID=47428 RepID=A0A284S577_ARMOS|nr:uncharacterized protein ARMOST_19681 [Armillaria ostoyae]